MSEFIGHIVDETPTSVTYGYQGDQVVGGPGDISLGDLGMSPHYTDSREAYRAKIEETSSYLASREVRVLRPDGTVETLMSAEDMIPLCDAVDAEYEKTVTELFRKITGNPEHRAPELDPRLAYASYVSLKAGGAVIIPTFVGKIISAASTRGLSTMFALKDRSPDKAGVAFTTIDKIDEIADIPEGWGGYVRHMYEHGIRVGYKLPRNQEHPMFRNQHDWLRQNSQQTDGTSMFIVLPGPYPDVASRALAADEIMLTGSSANKSQQPNSLEFKRLHPDIKHGADFVVWPETGTPYIIDAENESQGIMVDFRPEPDGTPKLHVIRLGFLNGPFFTQTRRYLADHPELGVEQPTFSVHNTAYQSNRR